MLRTSSHHISLSLGWNLQSTWVSYSWKLLRFLGVRYGIEACQLKIVRTPQRPAWLIGVASLGFTVGLEFIQRLAEFREGPGFRDHTTWKLAQRKDTESMRAVHDEG